MAFLDQINEIFSVDVDETQRFHLGFLLVFMCGKQSIIKHRD